MDSLNCANCGSPIIQPLRGRRLYCNANCGEKFRRKTSKKQYTPVQKERRRRQANEHYSRYRKQINDKAAKKYREKAGTPKHNILFSHAGKSQTLRDWAKDLGVTVEAIRSRIGRLQWPIEKALSVYKGGQY